MSLIEIKNLSFSYDKSRKVLNNINFNINQGEFIGILGKSGSGKSTLVQLIDGLLKPDSGSIFFDGIDIFKNPKKIQGFRFKIGLVMQNPEDQLFSETVFKDIAFGPTNMGLTKEQIENCVLKAIDFVDLDKSILDKSPFEISGGEKRRAAIAGVIAINPDVLILDEPTSGLDPTGQENLISQVKKYHQMGNKTVILISHNANDILKLADKVAIMQNGEIKAFDKTEKIFTNHKFLNDLQIELPEVTQIMLKLKNAGFDFKDNIFTVDSALNEILKKLNNCKSSF